MSEVSVVWVYGFRYQGALSDLSDFEVVLDSVGYKIRLVARVIRAKSFVMT